MADKKEKAPKSNPKSEKAKEAAKRKRKIVAKAKKAEKLAQEVKEALIERGYEFPAFPSNEYVQEFVAKHGYNPSLVLLNTIQVAEVDPDWKKRIVTPPGMRAE